MKNVLRHATAALLCSLGLSLSLLCCMGLLSAWWISALAVLGMTALLAVSSVKKFTGWLTAAVLMVGTLLWLSFGGIGTLKEIFHAATLHFTGVNGALPMVAQEAALVLSLLVASAGFVLTSPALGGFPAAAVTVLAALVLWLSDQPGALPWLAPALAGTLMQAAVVRHGEISLRRTLPLALMVAGLTMLLTPLSGVTIQPLKDAADTLREQFFARFMFTQPRNVFTLASEGYYPQGQNQLGGKAEPTDHPVMLVKTARKTYLRGSVKNMYTGRTWVDTLAGRRLLWSSLQWRDSRTDTFDMALPQGTLGSDSGLTAHQTVSVRMLDSSASSLFVPQRIRSLSPGGELVPYFNTSSEVFVPRDLQAEDTYTVTAPLMVAGDAGLGTLIQACEAMPDAHYTAILSDYTLLPEHLQEQVYQLAEEACAGMQTSYDKAYAIQTYLSRSFRYTLEVEPQPENLDFVSNFLLNTQEGYCTYFASAMTVLCRMAGLPARYVEGYLAEPDENGHAYVTGLNAHAWTEVYFSGFGWLTFDATPAQNRSSETPEELLPPDVQEPEATQQPSPEAPTPTPEVPPTMEAEEPTPTPPTTPDQPDASPRQKGSSGLPWLWLLLILLAAGCCLRILWVQPQHIAKRAKDEMSRWSAWMQAVSDALQAAGLPRQLQESPMAYMQRVDATHRFAAPMLPLGECMALVFYGRTSPEPEETAMAAAAYQQLLLRLSFRQKLRLTFRRAFVPLKNRSFTR